MMDTQMLCERYGVCSETIRRYVRQGKLPRPTIESKPYKWLGTTIADYENAKK
jgi:predicted site-specific integrase-resolvase